MTREEAIKTLYEYRHCLWDKLYEPICMAIKALEQEPCDKYINAIDHLRKYIYKLETQIVEQEPMRDFTEEEAKAYSKALDKMYKPTGFNVFNKPSGDLISRQAVLDGIEELKKSPWATDKRGNGFEYLITEALDVVKDLCVKQLPSVNPQEPKTGHWIEEDVFDGDVAYRCSECNELFWIESGTPKDNEYNFCPKCGAKMESEDKE